MTDQRPRIAYLTYGVGLYDARVLRMARTALAAGYAVTMYARWSEGLPATEERDGIRIVRTPYDWRLAVPGLRSRARGRAADAMREDALRGSAAARLAAPAAGLPPAAPSGIDAAEPNRPRGLVSRWRRRFRMFPLQGLGWAAALEIAAEPADLWHGMWAGSLPALARMRARHGGRTVYDSRDVYMQSRDLASAGWPGKAILEWLERRWVRKIDRVITVNDWYSQLLAAQLRIDPPRVIMNLPSRWTSDRRPDLIREALGLPSSTAVVLYQGGLMTGRGIEQAMDAILAVPSSVLCLLGFGALRDWLVGRSRAEPYEGRVFVLDPVSPDDLLDWTASADVSVMAIQPTSLNHEFTTPQKLFESIAVGVPVVAAELPGMAEVVRATGAGVLCDPTDPASIAAGIRELIEVPAEIGAARRARILDAAHRRYNWEAEEPILLGLYEELLSDDTAPVSARRRGPDRGGSVRQVGAPDPAAPARPVSRSTIDR